MDAKERIQTVLDENPVMIFMKGSPDFPQCGFSMQVAQTLKTCEVEFGYVDILAEPEIRSTLPKISNWPTFPQLFINGELVGGCDIALELFRKGELQEMLKQAEAKK